MVEDVVDDEVEVRRLRGQRGVERSVGSHDALVDRERESRSPAALHELLQQLGVVLAVDLAAWPDGANEQLGRVAAASPEVGDGHAGADPHEREQLGGVTLGVNLPVGVRAIGRGEERADGFGCKRRVRRRPAGHGSGGPGRGRGGWWRGCGFSPQAARSQERRHEAGAFEVGHVVGILPDRAVRWLRARCRAGTGLAAQACRPRGPCDTYRP